MTMTFRFRPGTFTRSDVDGKPQYATPLAIAMAVHYVTMAEPYSVNNSQSRYSAAVQEITKSWLNAGYLVPATGDYLKWGCEYEPTDALRLYVAALQTVPMPEKQWVIPSGVE